MHSEDNQKYIPVELSKSEYNNLIGAKQYEYKTIMIGNRRTKGILVPSTKEAYYGYMRIVNTDLKRKERESKCWITSPVSGKPIKCQESCRDCSRMRDGSALSLERLLEEDGVNPLDDSYNVLSLNLLYQDCIRILEKHDPFLAAIFECLYEGLSIDSIAHKFNLERNDARKLRTEVMTILQAVISKEDIFSK